MANDPDAIRSDLNALVQPEARARLLARGLARGMVWRDGKVPEGGPEFAASLTSDLLDYGYGVLALALELRDANRRREGQPFETQDAFQVAAEAIESAVRRGDPADPNQGRHLVVAAAAFHLAGFAARSFSLLPPSALEANLASPERALALLLRRDLLELRDQIVERLADQNRTDEALARRLLDEADAFGPEDAAVVALGNDYHRALGLADTALIFGDRDAYDTSVQILTDVISGASSIGNLPIWWVATLTAHLAGDLWTHSLQVRVPSGPAPGLPPRWDGLRRDLIALLSARRPPQIDLWPSQLAAASRALDPSDDLVVALPTSAGKTRIAELCILRALADRKRTVYVTPLRALSAQVEHVLARTFVPLGATVTSLYGASGATMVDTQTLVSADVVVATPEKLDFAIRQESTILDDVSLVVFDEGHMIGLGSREIRYEVLIQRLLRRRDAKQRRIVCLSAMFNPKDPYFRDFSNWLRSDEPGEFIHVSWRPTRQRLATLDWYDRSAAARLSFLEGEKPFVPRFFERAPKRGQRRHPFPKDEKEFCIAAANAFAHDGHSVLVYSPQRSQVEPLVREFGLIQRQGYLDGVKPPDARHLAVALAVGREWLDVDHPAVAGLAIGIGTHHGALPRPFLTAVEELIVRRRLPVVVASPTLAQGIDLACSVLIFRSLQRFDSATQGQVPISPTEFANVVGRAGRAYVDLDGIAVLPTFEAYSREYKHRMFQDLIKGSREQRLVSGLARLVHELGQQLASRLGVSQEKLLEYILNQRELWEDSRLRDEGEGDDDESERSFSEYLADLDVAVFSLVDALDSSPDELAKLLDEILKDSLWKRTLEHVERRVRDLERAVLLSRAEWLWRTTTAPQRRACFFAGLGRNAGVFLWDRLDELIRILTEFQAALVGGDGKTAGSSAVDFARRVSEESFFSPKRLPSNWERVLVDWVRGIAFAAILKGERAREAQRIQAFVQETVVFRLVWAAEAVRVQALSTGHGGATALGDGPAFALTYGVPSVAAALLCQLGFASRVGAVWATRRLAASFHDMTGLKEWLRSHREILSKADFWESEDHHLLWLRSASREGTDYPRPWKRRQHVVPADWEHGPLAEGERVRLVPRSGRLAWLCATDLTRLGTVRLPFTPNGSALDGSAADVGRVRVEYFGP